MTRLGLENIKKPKTIIETDVRIEKGEKVVDTVFLPTQNSKLYVSDYYPNKENPFVNYSLKDTVGKFKFYPVKLSLVISENKDGTFQVDTKMPEYFTIVGIKATGVRTKEEDRRTPFYLGGGIQKQGDKTPLSILGGVKIKNTLIIGGVNTEGQAEIKTMYNF